MSQFDISASFQYLCYGFTAKPAKFHNGGFTQDLYMHICSISVKF